GEMKMFRIKKQTNQVRQLLWLLLVGAMLTSLFAITTYPETRSRSSMRAKMHKAASPSTQPQTVALRANGKIAFTSNRDGNFEIYAMNSDGTGQTRLTTNQSIDSDPAFSPDGNRIAFRRLRDGSAEIYLMNSDGSNQTRLTNSPGNDNIRPAWSPDGTKIAFVR